MDATCRPGGDARPLCPTLHYGVRTARPAYSHVEDVRGGRRGEGERRFVRLGALLAAVQVGLCRAVEQWLGYVTTDCERE